MKSIKNNKESIKTNLKKGQKQRLETKKNNLLITFADLSLNSLCEFQRVKKPSKAAFFCGSILCNIIKSFREQEDFQPVSFILLLQLQEWTEI